MHRLHALIISGISVSIAVLWYFSVHENNEQTQVTTHEMRPPLTSNSPGVANQKRQAATHAKQQDRSTTNESPDRQLQTEPSFSEIVAQLHRDSSWTGLPGWLQGMSEPKQIEILSGVLTSVWLSSNPVEETLAKIDITKSHGGPKADLLAEKVLVSAGGHLDPKFVAALAKDLPFVEQKALFRGAASRDPRNTLNMFQDNLRSEGAATICREIARSWLELDSHSASAAFKSLSAGRRRDLCIATLVEWMAEKPSFSFDERAAWLASIEDDEIKNDIQKKEN